MISKTTNPDNTYNSNQNNIDGYEKLFHEISTAYKEDAMHLISDEKINSTIENEKEYIKKAKENGLSPMQIIHGNLAKYCKDMLRKDQPLYSVYYILSLFTQISYMLLICVAAKCVYLCFLGHKNVFSSNIPLSYTPYLVTLYFIVDDIIHHMQKKYILNDKTFNMAAARITEIILAAAGCVILYVFTKTDGIFDISLTTSFLITVAFLFLSGIHNVVYSSQFVTFFTIGFMTLTLRPAGETNNIISEFISKNPKNNDILKAHLKTDRIYCFIGAFISVILDIICIKQLLNKIVMPLTIFGVASLVITALFIAALISCSKIISQCNQA